jgi:hypothetical protein
MLVFAYQGSDFSVSLSCAGHWSKVLLVRKDLVGKHHQNLIMLPGFIMLSS